jgi:hypothetical protein
MSPISDFTTLNCCRKAGVTPWDAGETQPALKEAIESGIDQIRWPNSGYALVPGCGSVQTIRHRPSCIELTLTNRAMTLYIWPLR